ncbi:hypothetical protein Taro_033480 [Colocasia esculenta]|uniref:Uncharacterized protein n=1 Tax=Colocasia esculenta TaxID=4460 RepID=A0A843VTX4_COLES|nr:hypothetical protein [Colocasia esculenta]
MPTVDTSSAGSPRFCVSQARAVISGLCPDTCVVPSRSVSSDLDTLTRLLELYVRLRERRQWDSDYCTCLLVTCSALLVGGTDTSCRHWSPASPFPMPHSRGPSPGSLEVSGMGLQSCGLQVVGSFPTEPVTREAHPYPLSGEGEQETSHPSSSFEPHRSSAGSAPPPAEHFKRDHGASFLWLAEQRKVEVPSSSAARGYVISAIIVPPWAQSTWSNRSQRSQPATFHANEGAKTTFGEPPEQLLHSRGAERSVHSSSLAITMGQVAATTVSACN